MRILAFCAILAGLAACAAPPPPPPPALSVPPPGQRAGCIGTKLTDCMLSLAGAMWFDPEQAAHQLKLRHELDVNGKPAHRIVGFTASFPGSLVKLPVILRLAPDIDDDRVVGATIGLPHSPLARHTVREFDEIFLYASVATLLGKSCPDLDKLKFYQFFENTVKPAVVTDEKVERRGIFNHTTMTSRAEAIPFCGRRLSFVGMSEWEGNPSESLPRGVKTASVIALE